MKNKLNTLCLNTYLMMNFEMMTIFLKREETALHYLI